jgi:hypothetical protein
MPNNLLRYGGFIIAVSLLLGGCLETVGRPAYNHAPTASQASLCGLRTPDGGIVGYGCAAKQ